jgi:hypothetical protein
MKPSRNGIADACVRFNTAAVSVPGVSLEKGRNNGVSALFDSCGNAAVQIPAHAVTGRFRCLTVVLPDLPITSVIPAPE